MADAAVPAPAPAPVSAFAPIAPDGAGVPLFRAVKRALLRAIESGEAPPGEALPSESELAAAFGVSVGTLRHAVDELVAEHLLMRRQGRGTFVATHNDQRFLFQFFHVERSDGLRESPGVELLTFERLRLTDEDAAAALEVHLGDAVLQIENRLSLQGRPVVLDRLVIPVALFKGLTEKRFRERPGTIYRLYQSEFGITVVRARERARAVPADRSAARRLGVAAGTALTFGDRPVEYRVSTIDTAAHDYVQTLSRPE